jgi:hypothetical protein
MEDDLKQILEKLTKFSEENNVILKSIKRHFMWQRIFALFYFILIVGPIIIGIIYLPPLLNNSFSEYKDLLGLPSSGTVNINEVMKSIKNGAVNSGTNNQ